MTRAETLQTALEARLKTIRLGESVTVRGRSYAYRTDFGSNVTVRRQTPLSSGEEWMLNIVPGVPVIQTERAEFGLDRYRLETGVMLMARGGANVIGKDAAAMVALGVDDVRQALRSDPRWSGQARWSTVEPVGPDGELQAQLAAQKIYAIELLLTIDYTTNSGEV